jgi:acetyl esterase/lipase
MIFARAFRLTLSTLSVGSAGLGLLSMLPRLSPRTWLTQMALNEFPALPTLIGGAVSAAGWRYNSRTAFTLGTLGAAMSSLPALSVRATIRNMDSEMRSALGWNYESAIQPEALARCQPSRWSAKRTFTAHRRTRPDVTIERDVVYCRRPTRDLKVDIYSPKRPVTSDQRPASFDRTSGWSGKQPTAKSEASNDLLPAVIVLHPGAWSSGDKSWVFTPHDMNLASKGYVVFDIQYRFINETLWPGQMDDTREAIRWVKANAAKYGVDPSRIALFGRSAGGHIALSTAYQARGEFADTAVCAVVGIYPPSNFSMVGERVDHRIEALMGGDLTDMPERYYDASPLNHISHESPPTLLVHGQKDGLVYAINSEVMRWTLRRAGVPATLLRVPWAHHAFDGVPGGLGAQLVQYDIDRFLAWSLYHER